MRLAPEITLRPIAVPEPSDTPPRSDVLIAQRASGTVIDGSVLEAAVQCGPGWLLFVTDDTPFEELLKVVLLGPDGRLLDSAHIGGPYATGAFGGLRLDPPATVRFRFIDDADWSVEVLDKPQTSVPWWPDAKGVWRGKRLARHFRVRRSAA